MSSVVVIGVQPSACITTFLFVPSADKVTAISVFPAKSDSTITARSLKVQPWGGIIWSEKIACNPFERLSNDSILPGVELSKAKAGKLTKKVRIKNIFFN